MTATAPALAEGQLQVYASFEQVIDLIRSKRDMLLLNEVETGLRLARYAPGRIEFEPAPGAKPDLAANRPSFDGPQSGAPVPACTACSVIMSGN